MKYKINDCVEYVGTGEFIKQGHIIKIKGLFKNKYMIRIKVEVDGLFKKEIKDKVMVVNKKNIIGKVEKNAESNM